MKIGNHDLVNGPVFIVAELSANHGNDIEIAKKTILAAKETGADAIKLQTYTPDSMTLNSSKDDFTIKGTIWEGRNLYELYQEAQTPLDWHQELFDYAKEVGITCFSTPFDFHTADFLEELDVPAYKIASFEITDIPLIRHVAKKGKPIIISTGIANHEDIQLAIETIRAENNNDIAILKCTSSYPAPFNEANLRMIRKFAEDFNVISGLSDHTLGYLAPAISVTMGSRIIEKHFILDRELGGPDASFSLDKDEFKLMVEQVRNTEDLIGVEDTYELTDKQSKGRQFARSIYVANDINVGETLEEKHLRIVRPGFGMHPKHLETVIGKKVLRSLTVGDRLTEDVVEGFNSNN